MLPRRRPFFPLLQQARRLQLAALLDNGALADPTSTGVWGLPV